jgi:hypothetical protein
MSLSAHDTIFPIGYSVGNEYTIPTSTSSVHATHEQIGEMEAGEQLDVGVFKRWVTMNKVKAYK